MKINREETLQTLSRLKPAIASRGTIPELQHLWADKGTVRAYDSRLGIKVDLKLGFIGGVPGTTLLGLLGSSAAEEVKLENSNNALSLGLGRASAKLAVLENKSNPWGFPEKLPTDAWQIKITEGFLEALDNVLLVGASFIILYPANKKGVFLTADADISFARGFAEGKLPNNQPIVLPSEFLAEVARQCNPGARLLLFENYAMAEDDGLQIYGHQVEANAGDLDKSLDPYLKDNSPSPIPEGLDEALKRATVLGGREAIVKLAAEEGQLTVSGRYDLGEFTETLPIKGECAGEVLVRADLLLALLKKVDTIAISERDALILRGPRSLAYVLQGAGA